MPSLTPASAGMQANLSHTAPSGLLTLLGAVAGGAVEDLTLNIESARLQASNLALTQLSKLKLCVGLMGPDSSDEPPWEWVGEVQGLKQLEVHGRLAWRRTGAAPNLSALTALTSLRLSMVPMPQGISALHVLRDLDLSFNLNNLDLATLRHDWSNHPHLSALSMAATCFPDAPQRLRSCLVWSA